MEVPKPTYSDENGPPLMTALHAKCIGCHRAMEKGPTMCGDCHLQSFSGVHGLVEWDHRLHARGLDMNEAAGMDDNCLHCHHQDQHAQLDGEFRACGTCHKPFETMHKFDETKSWASGVKGHEEFKHGTCSTCHSVSNPEDDPVSCASCHADILVNKEDGERPSIEQAVHERCLECHNIDYPNLTASMPVYCDDCHKPDPSWLEVPEKSPILWDHRVHAMYSQVECTTCHHTDSEGEHHMACYKCHDNALFDNPSVQKALTKNCEGCHQERKVVLDRWDDMNSEEAAKSHFTYESPEGTLWWDHRGHALNYQLSCQNCHHYLIQKDGQFIIEAKLNRALPEEYQRVQSCRNCHGEEGPVPGSIAEGSQAPQLHKAMTTICTTCHIKLEGGPQTWEALFATEPLDLTQSSEGGDHE